MFDKFEHIHFFDVLFYGPFCASFLFVSRLFNILQHISIAPENVRKSEVFR